MLSVGLDVWAFRRGLRSFAEEFAAAREPRQ
jgi:hypothetical protein